MSVRLRLFRQVRARLPISRLHKLFDAVIAGEFSKQTGEIHLIVASPRKIRTLNHAFRQKDAATDVLSFPIEVGRSSGDLIGEIYICRDIALQQASAYGATASEEYLRLFCHGLLHLAGYDHGTKRAETRMFTLQNAYLSAVAPGYLQ